MAARLPSDVIEFEGNKAFLKQTKGKRREINLATELLTPIDRNPRVIKRGADAYKDYIKRAYVERKYEGVSYLAPTAYANEDPLVPDPFNPGKRMRETKFIAQLRSGRIVMRRLNEEGSAIEYVPNYKLVIKKLPSYGVERPPFPELEHPPVLTPESAVEKIERETRNAEKIAEFETYAYGLAERAYGIGQNWFKDYGLPGRVRLSIPYENGRKYEYVKYGDDDSIASINRSERPWKIIGLALMKLFNYGYDVDDTEESSYRLPAMIASDYMWNPSKHNIEIESFIEFEPDRLRVLAGGDGDCLRRSILQVTGIDIGVGHDWADDDTMQKVAKEHKMDIRLWINGVDESLELYKKYGYLKTLAIYHRYKVDLYYSSDHVYPINEPKKFRFHKKTDIEGITWYDTPEELRAEYVKLLPLEPTMIRRIKVVDGQDTGYTETGVLLGFSTQLSHHKVKFANYTATPEAWDGEAVASTLFHKQYGTAILSESVQEDSRFFMQESITFQRNNVKPPSSEWDMVRSYASYKYCPYWHGFVDPHSILVHTEWSNELLEKFEGLAMASVEKIWPESPFTRKQGWFTFPEIRYCLDNNVVIHIEYAVVGQRASDIYQPITDKLDMSLKSSKNMLNILFGSHRQTTFIKKRYTTCADIKFGEFEKSSAIQLHQSAIELDEDSQVLYVHTSSENRSPRYPVLSAYILAYQRLSYHFWTNPIEEKPVRVWVDNFQTERPVSEDHFDPSKRMFKGKTMLELFNERGLADDMKMRVGSRLLSDAFNNTLAGDDYQACPWNTDESGKMTKKTPMQMYELIPKDSKSLTRGIVWQRKVVDRQKDYNAYVPVKVNNSPTGPTVPLVSDIRFVEALMHKRLVISGPPGAGKSYIIQHYLKNKGALITASTHDAVLSVNGECTTQALIAVCKQSSSEDQIFNAIGKRFPILVIDEYSMLGQKSLDVIHAKLPSVKVILVGDTQQLMNHEDPMDELYLHNNEYFFHVLDTNYRAGDALTKEVYASIRGCNTEEIIHRLKKNIPTVDESKIDFDSTIFTSRNSDMLRFNKMYADSRPGFKQVWGSKDKVMAGNCWLGMRVQFMASKRATKNSPLIPNGTIAVVKSMPYATGCDRVFISINDDINIEVLTKYLLPAFARTYHRAQGKTYKEPIYAYLPGIFSKRQLYVAATRVTDIKMLTLVGSYKEGTEEASDTEEEFD